MLIVADAAARLDPIQGFEIMKSAVAAINHADAGSKSDRNAGFDVSLLNFDQGFPLLARADFERTLSLAQGIEKKEASVIVQLAVCRGVLIKPREAPQENDSKAKRQ